MAVYSQRFLLFPGGPAALVVPSGKRMVVKCISLANSNAGAAAFTLWIDNFRILRLNPPGADGLLRDSLQIVLNPGESLSIGYDAGVQGTVSGYMLDLIP